MRATSRGKEGASCFGGDLRRRRASRICDKWFLVALTFAVFSAIIFYVEDEEISSKSKVPVNRVGNRLRRSPHVAV